MLIHQTLIRERCFDGVPGNSKKRILENCSDLIAEQVDGLDAEEVFAGLINRERLGSTGIGEGVAIPHCRLDECKEAVGALVKLPEPIDFDAIDKQPVDLLFVLLVPSEATEAHLQILAALAEMFNEPSLREKMRAASDSSELYKVAVDYEMEHI